MLDVNSFMYGTHDMFAEFGVRVIAYDVLLPKLRERKIVLPKRSGSYDMGGQYYDERVLEMQCDSLSNLSRSDLRELSYILSKKQKIVMGDEQDKYYYGRIYDPSQIDHIGYIGTKFDLSFVCEPFAYKNDEDKVSFQLAGIIPSITVIDYNGTERAPTKIVIRNTGSTTVDSVKIRIRERRDA